MEPVEKPQPAILRGVFFWTLAALSLFSLLGATLLYAAEARYAEAVREMFLSGNWLVPTFNGVTLSPRPLLMHWMMLGSCTLSGVCNEFSLRLPSVLAGLLTLFAVRRMGTKLFSLECGRTASYLLLGCFGFLFWSRSATAEMWNTCVIALGMMWFYELRENPGFWNLFTLALFFLLGTLFKRIYAAMALGVLLLPALLEPAFLRRLKIQKLLPALLLALALFGFLKYVLSGSVCGMLRSLSDGVTWDGEKFFRRPFFYFRELPMPLMPWTLVLLLCPAGMLRNWKKQSKATHQLLCGMLLTLIVLAALPWTQEYYALGLLIPLTLCSAAALVNNEGMPKWNNFSLSLMRFLVTMVASAAVVSLIFLPFWKIILGYNPPRFMLISVFLTGVVSLGIVLHAEFDTKKIAEALTGMRQNIAVTILAADLLCCGFTAVIQPQYYLTWTERKFLTEVHTRLADIPSSRIVYWGNPALRFLFYFDRPDKLNATHSSAELKALWEASPDGLWLLTRNTPEEMEQLTKGLKKQDIPFHPENPVLQEKLRAIDEVDAAKFSLFKLERETPGTSRKAGL